MTPSTQQTIPNAILAHEDLRVYQKAIAHIGNAESLRAVWPSHYAVNEQIGRASESIVLHIAEATASSSRASRVLKSDYALGSVLECAACLDIAGTKQLSDTETLQPLKFELSKIAKMLIGLREAWGRRESQIHESTSKYGTDPIDSGFLFHHERLDVYQIALEFISWWHTYASEETQAGRHGRQIDASSTSMVLNIAEGNGRFSELDHCRFLEIAEKSAVRTAAQLDIAVERNVVDSDDASHGKELLTRVVAMLVPLARSIKGTSDYRK